MLEHPYSFMGGALFRTQSLSFPTYKIHSQLQSSRRHFQSSCIAGLCVILRKLLEKISIFEKYSELMLPASSTLLNHLKPCHTNIAMCPCWWWHRSEGQMISQLRYYPVYAHRWAQPKWYFNKQSGTKHLQEKNNMSKVVHFITDLCLT